MTADPQAVQPMPPIIPQLILNDGTVIDCREGGVLGRQGDLATEQLAREAVLSRRHLLLQPYDGVWFLTLLPDARNKTWLDGEELHHGVSRQLDGEHDLQVGDKHFGIRLRNVPADDTGMRGFPWSVAAGDGGEEFDALALGAGVNSSGTDLVAALDSLRQLPGCQLLLDDDLRVWWLSSAAAAALGPDVVVGTDFLTLVGVTEVPGVRDALEAMRGTGGSTATRVAGLPQPLRFTYQFPFFLGHSGATRSPAGGAATGDSATFMSILAGHALSPAFQTGDVAKAITLATADACRELACHRVAVWFAAESTATEIVCRSLQTRNGAGLTGGRVRMNHCPAFFDTVCDDSPVATAKAGDPVLTILKEIGFVDTGTSTVLAAAIRQGDTFLGVVVFERDGVDMDWHATEKNFAVCNASMCLLAMQTRRSAENLAELKEKEVLLAGGLAEARRYVRRLLPEPMRHPAVDAEWYFEPSETLGGDAFGYHWLDEDRLAMYVLDVVGHGTGAALLAVSVINTLRGRLVSAGDFADPAAVLSAVNRSFQMEDQGMMTFTAWYGVFDRARRTITYSSAGHPPALLVWPHHEGGGLDFRELGTEGLIIGGMDDAVYTNAVVEMGPALAKLYLYSDGAFEIPLGPNRFWSFEEFIAAVRATRTMTSGEPEYLYERARTLCVANALPDDFSMVRFLFAPAGAT